MTRMSLCPKTEKSLRSMTGVQASKAMGFSAGVFVAQLNVDWLHEFEDDQHLITARFAEDLRPETTFDHDYLEQSGASLGLRREF
jgi:Autotransporter beta-domain